MVLGVGKDWSGSFWLTKLRSLFQVAILHMQRLLRGARPGVGVGCLALEPKEIGATVRLGSFVDTFIFFLLFLKKTAHCISC